MRHSSQCKADAITLRRSGRTHREIARTLGISSSTAYLWTKGIHLSAEQKKSIEQRRARHRMSDAERKEISTRLAAYRTKYTKNDLLLRIQNFVREHGRIPFKREFNAWDPYILHFKSWNAAIREAGFAPNPELFAHSFIAPDGHRCNSYSEWIIDSWLQDNYIEHNRHTPYGFGKYTADFELKKTIIMEFFGLAGVRAEYDRTIIKKREFAKCNGWELIEIYPSDLFPENRLPLILARYM